MTHDPNALAPVTPVAFHILFALAMGERHGYAVMDAPALNAGAVYRTITHLVAAGLVTPDARPTPTSDDERRRYYRLTSRGRAVAQAEMRRLVGYARAALLTMGAGARESDDDHHAPSPPAAHRSVP